VIRTMMNQVKQPSPGPITFHPQFVYAFRIDASHIKMPPHWQKNETVDADEISSPRVLGLKEKIRVTTSPKGVTFSSSSHPTDDMMQQMLDAQMLLAQNLDPSTFGQAIATAVSAAMTTSTGSIGTQVSVGISKAMTDVLIQALQAGIPTMVAKIPKLSGTTAVVTRGSPSNPLTIVLGPNESIADFISELPKTLGKIPCLGAWNENILPPCVKFCYDAARNIDSLLTCELINMAYVYDADDGTNGLTAGDPVIPK
jgi:hypothetical protein